MKGLNLKGNGEITDEAYERYKAEYINNRPKPKEFRSFFEGVDGTALV